MIKPYIVYILLVVGILTHAIERTQEIKLKKGWNAVYLEVDPQIEKQNLSAFMMPKGEDNQTVSTPISTIATYYSSYSSVEYIDDPTNIGWKKSSWHRWIREDDPEAFLTNLYDLGSNQGYLVKSDKAFTWKVTGEVKDKKRIWQPNSYNLVGFNIDGYGPSFYQYFQNNNAAKALQEGPVYTLENGSWKKVNMVDTAVEPNKAYWVYAKGTPDFEGVLDVGVQNGSREMIFLDLGANKRIEMKNSSSQVITVTVSLENNQIPLTLVEKNALFERTYTPISGTFKTLTIEGGGYEELMLSVRLNEMTGRVKREGLLKFTVSGVNEVYYIPLSAYGG